MITEKQKSFLLELVDAYAVNESLRGYFIGADKAEEAKTQEYYSLERKKQIRTFLDNITVNQVEN